MDLLKKIFGINKQPVDSSVTAPNEKFKRGVSDAGNSFKKPLWYDEESDDELFDSNKIVGFQMFTNPMEIQKYHEQQMERMMRAFKQSEGLENFIDENLREEYLKPGFERFKDYENIKPSADVDLDGEIYADQLHSLLQRFSPGTDLMIREKDVAVKTKPKRKLTDDEKIFNQIHCVDDQTDEKLPVKPNSENVQLNNESPSKGGAFEGFVGGPKTHRQSYSFHIIRRPNESSYTKTVTDSNGNTITVNTKTVDGETKSQTIVNGLKVDGDITEIKGQEKSRDWIVNYGRHIQINKDGYALPKNLW